MSTTVPTRESLKEKAKVIRKFLKERCNVDVSHSHCIELVSKAVDFNDWNTASATLKSKVNPKDLPFKIETVGEMRRALEGFKDSDIIDGMYEFDIKQFLEELDNEMELHAADGTITQEFSFTLEHLRDNHEIGIASFKLKIEDETITETLPVLSEEEYEEYEKQLLGDKVPDEWKNPKYK